MNKGQRVFHGLFLGAIAAFWLALIVPFLLMMVTGQAEGFGGTNHFEDILVWRYLYRQGFFVMAVLCLGYGAIAPWMHPSKHPVLRVLKTALLLLVVAWLLWDYFCFDFYAAPKPEINHGGLDGALREYGYYLDNTRFNYFVLALFAAFLHVGELYFLYPRKGKKEDGAFCILPAYVIVGGLIAFFSVFATRMGYVFLIALLLPLLLSLYVLYASAIKVFRRGLPPSRRAPAMVTMILTFIQLLCPIFLLKNFPLSLWLVFARERRGLLTLLLMVYLGCFFAQWALGVLQRSLEATWERREKKLACSPSTEEAQA